MNYKKQKQSTIEELRNAYVKYEQYPAIILLINKLNELISNESLKFINFVIKNLKKIQEKIKIIRKIKIEKFEKLNYKLVQETYNIKCRWFAPHFQTYDEDFEELTNIVIICKFEFIHNYTYIYNYVDFNIQVGFEYCVSSWCRYDKVWYVNPIIVTKDTLK